MEFNLWSQTEVNSLDGAHGLFMASCSVAMENRQLKERLLTAELAGAAQRAGAQPLLSTGVKEGASNAPDNAQLGELTSAYKQPFPLGAGTQQPNTLHTPWASKFGDRLLEPEAAAIASMSTPADARDSAAAWSEHEQGGEDTVGSSAEDTLLRDAISEWQALCQQRLPACSCQMWLPFTP